MRPDGICGFQVNNGSKLPQVWCQLVKNIELLLSSALAQRSALVAYVARTFGGLGGLSTYSQLVKTMRLLINQNYTYERTALTLSRL
jgi:hypothetical protein